MWLVVKYKTESFLFIQTRTERENMLSVLIDEKIEILTLVVNRFDDFDSASEYCKRINNVSRMLQSIFITK